MKNIVKNIYKIYNTISSGIEINSKKIKKDSIFIALKGKNFDGNDFALEAIKNGAILSIVDNKKYLYEKNKKILFVNNTLEFLQKLAIYHRKKNHHIPIIAITGSNGKTTTRELIKIILYKKYKNVHSTQKNYNNHIGVPLTILSMPKNTKISIIEIGSNHEGEIDKMCSIINPDYGYITNFGKSHLKGFKSFEGIIRGKLELYKFLEKKKKLVFINADDPIQLFHSKKMKKFIFSIKNENIQSNIKFISPSKKKDIQTILYIQNVKIKSSLIGDYNIYNIASSITIGFYFKISIDHIQKSIQKYIPNNYRSQLIKINNKKIILDCYNANPTSMMEALTFFNNHIYGTKIVILGDMLELGIFSKKEHENILLFIKHSNINFGFLIGDIFFHTNIYYKKIKKFLNKQSFFNWIKKNPIQNTDFILIKGSRKIALENIIHLI